MECPHIAANPPNLPTQTREFPGQRIHPAVQGVVDRIDTSPSGLRHLLNSHTISFCIPAVQVAQAVNTAEDIIQTRLKLHSLLLKQIAVIVEVVVLSTRGAVVQVRAVVWCSHGALRFRVGNFLRLTGLNNSRFFLRSLYRRGSRGRGGSGGIKNLLKLAGRG